MSKELFREHLQQIRELASKGDLSHLVRISMKGVNDAYKTKTTNKEKHVAVAKAAQGAALKMVTGPTKDGPKVWLKKALKSAMKKRDWKKKPN